MSTGDAFPKSYQKRTCKRWHENNGQKKHDKCMTILLFTQNIIC